MRIYYRTGLELPAGVIRAMIPNHQDHGSTSGSDLVGVMRLFGLHPVQLPLAPNIVLQHLQKAVVLGIPPIILGNWVSPLILHWVLVVDALTTGIVVNDPWGGVRRFLPHDLVLQRYAGDCIL